MRTVRASGFKSSASSGPTRGDHSPRRGSGRQSERAWTAMIGRNPRFE